MNSNPKNTIFNVKRVIGRTFDDHNLQSDMEKWPYSIINYNNNPKILVDHMGESKAYYPEEITAMQLTKMKHMAEHYFGKVNEFFGG